MAAGDGHAPAKPVPAPADTRGMLGTYAKQVVKGLSAVVLAAGVAGSQSGCLVVAAAAGTGATVAYVRGDTESYIEATPQQVAEAAEKAMKDLQVVVVAKHASAIDAKVTGRTARDTRLIVDARGNTVGSSKVSIRAGRFGDDDLQAQLLAGIRRNLGLPPADSIQPAPAATAATPPADQPATQPAVADTK